MDNWSENLKISNEWWAVDTLTKEDIELLLKNKWLPTNLREKLLAMLWQENEQFENKEDVMDQKTINWFLWIENLDERKNEIIKYLKENYVSPKEWEESEHVKEYWVMWIRYSLTLPSVNWFKCKKIKFFVSDEEFIREEYERHNEWIYNSCGVDEISINIFWNMRDFLWEFRIFEDVDMDFTKELFFNYSSDTWRNINKLMDLKFNSWLKDTSTGSRVVWVNSGSGKGDVSTFRWRDSKNFPANLLMWLTVS